MVDMEQGQEEIKNNYKVPTTAAMFEETMKAYLGQSFDVVISKIKTEKQSIIIVFIDGMTNKDLLERDVINPIKSDAFDGNLKKAIHTTFEEVYDIDSALKSILDGNVIVYADNAESIIVSDLKGWDKRAITTPEAEGSTRGPKEGFTETMLVNLTMLRRKLKTPNLKLENMVLGRQSNTLVSIAYLEGIVNESVLKELKKRLKKIDVDAILESGNIEQYIEENPYDVVSGIGLTQKPDVAAARILEGRIAVFTDGTPHVLTVPELFTEALQNSEDYYSRTIHANFIRLLRVFAFIISILLPGLAVAVISFNQEMMPFVFLVSFINSTKGTPLPEAAEIFFLMVMFELIKEAGLRMPKAIGSAITIVGALILGDVAVSSGIVGAPSVMIIALTAVSSLLVSNLNEFVTLYRFIFLAFGATMGIIGIAAGFFILVTQLASKESFGIPILSSFSKEEMKDSLIRFPLRTMTFRPESIAKENRKRQNFMSSGGNND